MKLPILHELFLLMSLAAFLVNAKAQLGALGGALTGGNLITSPAVGGAVPTGLALPAGSGVSDAFIAGATALAGALPLGIPIPALGTDEKTLITSLTRVLQILQFAIGLLQTLAGAGTINIPGVGDVGVAVEGFLINALLQLAANNLPKVPSS